MNQKFLIFNFQTTQIFFLKSFSGLARFRERDNEIIRRIGGREEKGGEKSGNFVYIFMKFTYSQKISFPRYSAKIIRKFARPEIADSMLGSRYEHVRLRVPQESHSQALEAFRVIFEFET